MPYTARDGLALLDNLLQGVTTVNKHLRPAALSPCISYEHCMTPLSFLVSSFIYENAAPGDPAFIRLVPMAESVKGAHDAIVGLSLLCHLSSPRQYHFFQSRCHANTLILS